MTASPSATTWLRVIAQAHDGDPRHLLELLLSPTQTNGQGDPLPGSFYELPDDGRLRLAIVRALTFGPWKGATSVAELATKTGWGKGKPRLSDLEVSVAKVFIHLSDVPDRLERIAAAHGVEPETLRKRIAKVRRPR